MDGALLYGWGGIRKKDALAVEHCGRKCLSEERMTEKTEIPHHFCSLILSIHLTAACCGCGTLIDRYRYMFQKRMKKRVIMT